MTESSLFARAVRGLVIAILLAGCSVTVTGGGVSVNDNAGWTRSANYTTCDQWRSEMTAAQRAAMVRPILAVLRRTVDTAASDGAEMLSAFVDAVSAACATDSLASYRPSGLDYVVTAAATTAFLGAEGQGSAFQP